MFISIQDVEPLIQSFRISGVQIIEQNLVLIHIFHFIAAIFIVIQVAANHRPELEIQ